MKPMGSTVTFHTQSHREVITGAITKSMAGTDVVSLSHTGLRLTEQATKYAVEFFNLT